MFSPENIALNVGDWRWAFGYVVTEILDAARESASTGRRVNLR
jgi:hypothetical protein